MNYGSEKIERLLALILLQNLKDAKMLEKIQHLNIAGFSNVEIAELLSVSPNVIAGTVAQSIIQKRKATKTKNK